MSPITKQKVIKTDDDIPKRTRPPARTRKDREDELIGLAVDLAEKQLREGTASTQVIVHYLKLASPRSDLEREKLESENALLKVKADAIEAEQRTEEAYLAAIEAMRVYQGADGDEYEE